MQPREYKVVIVDDIDRNIILLEAILKKCDFNIHVESAMDGVNGIELINSFRPDLILLDIMLPDMSGFDICKKIKEHESTAEIPVIFLTALGEVESIIEGLNLGAVDYITKPFHKDVLLSRINNCLKLVETQQSLNHSLRELDTLIRVLCHDLKNPIAGGQELLDCFLDMHPDLKEDDIIQHVQEAFESSMGIIKNVSMLSRLGSDQFELAIRNVQLLEMVHDALKVLNSSIENKELEVRLDVAADCYLEVDPNAFVSSVIINALTNAIKFSHKGDAIEIVDFDAGEEYGFTIRDFGSGMPANVIDQLMAGDEIVSTKGTMGEAGTGYGLKLMKRFVEMFGARLEIISSETNLEGGFVGTNVTFWFKKY